MMCKSSSYIIFILITRFCKLLEFRNDQIIASGSLAEWSHIIMYFFTSVNAQYNVAHFFVTELHYFIIEKYTVGSQCETEFFVVGFFLGTSICHQILYHLPVHKRLSAKKVYFQVLSGTGIGNKEIQSFLSYFIRHQCSSSMIFPFFGKTIPTCQITVMCNMKT